MGEEKSDSAKINRRRKFVLPMVILLIFIVVFIFIIKFLNGPAEGTISQTPSQTKYKSIVKPSTPGQYDGKLISFNYPSHFSITASPKNPGYLETVTFYSKDHSGKQVAIGVVKESLNNDSSINYRQAHPEIYKKQTDSFNNLVFIKDKEGSEYTGYLVKNDMVASISLSSTYTKDLSADYNEIVKNWQWK